LKAGGTTACRSGRPAHRGPFNPACSPVRGRTSDLGGAGSRLDGTRKERSATAGPFRQTAPRFTGENLDRNLALVEALRSIADAKGATVAHLAIAWVLSRGEDVVPLVGARRRDQLAEALGATELRLTGDDLASIERAVPPGAAAGDRYHAPQMASLDSELGGTTAG
jgi:hypothetical protein